ncbi:MAG: selenocysteine-specific translation elongation factor [Candidatus Eremiobacteraeota bacterium]|nr:selenocysteine-specific translation elongation factor [Candidatus Eremiobacteraeota bacterium]
MHIIGTAGHVDHGKSSLVAALTGTNPDRWLEEQLRGMTLDLGFAHIHFEDGTEAGIVDVPGHERFLHNMLAGAAGMELLLLIVAANEGVRSQTLEHLAILRYLNVRRTIVVVTKADLLGPDELRDQVEIIVAELGGTLAQDAPLVCVSSETRVGIDELRERIHAELALLPTRNPSAPVYLPIDRVFAIAGLGTVVTGTLMQGRIKLGDQLRLEPSGKLVRVRSLQVFGRARESADGGSRVAVNLPNVNVPDIARGEVLASPQFEANTTFAIQFEPLQTAVELLNRRNAVRVYIGAAEILGTLVFDQPPRDRAVVQATLYLRKPTIAYPGVNLVVRRMSPKTLLGGGTIIGLSAAQTESPAAASPHEASIVNVLGALGLQATDPAKIAALANVREEIALTELEKLATDGGVLRVQRPVAFIDGAAANALLARMIDHLTARQRAEPWSLGSASLLLARALSVDEPLLLRLLAAFVDDGRIAGRSGYFYTLDHTPQLSPAQRHFFDEAVRIEPDQPFVPAVLAEVLAQMKVGQIEGVSKAFDTLLARGIFVKVGEHLYRGTQIATIHAKVESFIRAEKQMSMAQFRDLVGTSRKFAVPLLEWFDARGITIRSGDYRMLRARKERTD